LCLREVDAVLELIARAFIGIEFKDHPFKVYLVYLYATFFAILSTAPRQIALPKAKSGELTNRPGTACFGEPWTSTDGSRKSPSKAMICVIF
jgi:hypothetical protein